MLLQAARPADDAQIIVACCKNQQHSAAIGDDRVQSLLRCSQAGKYKSEKNVKKTFVRRQDSPEDPCQWATNTG